MILWLFCLYCLIWGFIIVRLLVFFIFFDEEKYLDKVVVFVYLVSVENMLFKVGDLFLIDLLFIFVVVINVLSCFLLVFCWGIFSFFLLLSIVGFFFFWVDVLVVILKINFFLFLIVGRLVIIWLIFFFSWVFCKLKNVSKIFKFYEWLVLNFFL